METIELKKIIKTQETVQKENYITICNQKDDPTQKTGILTIQEEMMLLKRAGKTFQEKSVKEVDYEKAKEVEKKNYAEIFDLYDDKRRLDKEIKENNKKIEELSQENKAIYNRIQEEMKKPEKTPEKTE